MLSNAFDSSVFFSGGSGMFIQYHDVVKPVWLSVIMRLVSERQNIGLPINIISNMSILSVIEWYINRRYANPLRCIDYNRYLTDEKSLLMMRSLLLSDSSIYDTSPPLNIQRMFSIYKKQHMSFPLYIYSEYEEPWILQDIKSTFSGIKTEYIYGDLDEAIRKCNTNFTYIFSDIELAKKACEILKGTCSHILISQDYRYNYIGNFRAYKYDLQQLSYDNPYCRIGTISSIDKNALLRSFLNY